MPGLTQAAIDVSRELGATLMLPASVYNFGEAMPPVLHEDTPQQPSTFKGRMRVASEQQIREATQDGRMKAVVIRGGDFFGSGTGSWLDLVMAKGLRRGSFTYPGDVRRAHHLGLSCRTWPAASSRSAQQRHRLPAFEMLHFGGYQPHRAGLGRCSAQPIAREQGWVETRCAVARGIGFLDVHARGGPVHSDRGCAVRDALPVAHAVCAGQRPHAWR